MKAATLVAVGLLVLVPFAAGIALDCLPACEVEASDLGYTSPVTVISSGMSIAWRSVDNAHLTQDTATGGNECFKALSAGHETSDPVRFDLADGVLTATVDGETLPCNLAIVSPDAAVLLYHCFIHPPMRGAIVVVG